MWRNFCRAVYTHSNIAYVHVCQQYSIKNDSPSIFVYSIRRYVVGCEGCLNVLHILTSCMHYVHMHCCMSTIFHEYDSPITFFYFIRQMTKRVFIFKTLKKHVPVYIHLRISKIFKQKRYFLFDNVYFKFIHVIHILSFFKFVITVFKQQKLVSFPTLEHWWVIMKSYVL